MTNVANDDAHAANDGYANMRNNCTTPHTTTPSPMESSSSNTGVPCIQF